ncbi:BMP family ABC transporter substrate-binding protein [Marinilactibacillus sp. 15R]|uniref:Nucleoside-binding protein n=1 Tax=Marinilactibacillus piezotolerans TaxID=258723 RepID=A0A1I3WPR3_9LACT|nr:MULTISPECIES: BMP family protein [Marinilactibacillus]API89947.1 BMP family ABC transporter substrate-binding protein [Marinilactibacillus sp. 15R]SFK09163.1 nucleoside-binding protein [Marinilactibacillus piezotolerans]
MTTKLRNLFAIGASAFLLAACQGENAGDSSEGAGDSNDTDTEETADFKLGMVTDEGGVDDRSFNQSGWEGMQAWAEEHGVDDSAVKYYQSDDAADFVPNLNQAIQDQYDIIYGVGFQLSDAVTQVADANPDQHFGIVDAVVEKDNVVSLNFRDNEAAYLVGVAAAHTTETDKVGFIGGIAGPVIDKFEAGFVAGVESVDPEIEIDIQYAESFSDAAIGQQIAAGMYSSGADVIYHASGAVGNGVFTEATDRMESGSENQLWVIGVDRDQEELGEYADGNLTLTSSLKGVGTAIQLASNQAMEEGFPGGENLVYGLAEDGVGITEGNMSEDAWAAVEEARQQILDGEIEVPEAPEAE